MLVGNFAPQATLSTQMNARSQASSARSSVSGVFAESRSGSIFSAFREAFNVPHSPASAAKKSYAPSPMALSTQSSQSSINSNADKADHSVTESMANAVESNQKSQSRWSSFVKNLKKIFNLDSSNNKPGNSTKTGVNHDKYLSSMARAGIIYTPVVTSDKNKPVNEQITAPCEKKEFRGMSDPLKKQRLVQKNPRMSFDGSHNISELKRKMNAAIKNEKNYLEREKSNALKYGGAEFFYQKSLSLQNEKIYSDVEKNIELEACGKEFFYQNTLSFFHNEFQDRHVMDSINSGAGIPHDFLRDMKQLAESYALPMNVEDGKPKLATMDFMQRINNIINDSGRLIHGLNDEQCTAMRSIMEDDILKYMDDLLIEMNKPTATEYIDKIKSVIGKHK